jgi:presenilin-like A22 family membrane protease
MSQILVMFMIVQFLGLLLATQWYYGVPSSYLSSTQAVSGAAGTLIYIAYIIGFSLLIVIVLRFYNGELLFRVLEALVIFISSFFVFLIVAGTLNSSAYVNVAGSPVPIYLMAATLAALLLVVLKNKWPRLRNTTAMIASVGVGIVLGVSFPFSFAYLFMVVLAVYDFIAVFITKHMITMAKAMSSMNLSFLVGVNEVEAVPEESIGKKEMLGYRKELAEARRKSPAMRQIIDSKFVPFAAHIELGTGDLGVPLMLAVAAYRVSLNFTLSLFITIGATAGLIVTMYILRKYKRALPAIPPLLAGITVAMLAYLLVYGYI